MCVRLHQLRIDIEQVLVFAIIHVYLNSVYSFVSVYSYSLSVLVRVETEEGNRICGGSVSISGLIDPSTKWL